LTFTIAVGIGHGIGIDSDSDSDSDSEWNLMILMYIALGNRHARETRAPQFARVLSP